MKIRVLFLLTYWCLLINCTLGENKGWTRLAPDGAGFSVTLPGQTTHTTSSSESFFGPIVAQVFQYAQAESSCTVVYSDIPKTAVLLAGKDRIFGEARKEILRRTGANQTSYETLWKGRYNGRLLNYNSQDRVGTAQMYLVHNRLYVVDVSSSAQAELDGLEGVFDSLTLAADNA